MALRSLLKANAKDEFRKLSESLFPKEEEVKFYNWIRKHLRTHKKLPSLVTARAHGFEMPKTEEPVEYYLDRLYDRGILYAIQSRQEMLAKAMASGDMKKALAICREQVQAAMSVQNPDEFATLAKIAKQEVLRDYFEMKFSGELPGITTGWQTMDRDTLGLCGGDLFTFAGRPGLGKTWRLLFMARAAWLAGFSPLVCSNEMLNPALVRRLLGLHSGINPRAIRSGKLQHWTEKKLLQVIDSLDDMPPFYLVAGKFNKTVGGIERLIEYLQPDGAYLDAAYLFKAAVQRRNASQSDDLAENIHAIKDLSQTYNIPSVITVQFNRNVDTNAKGGKRRNPANSELDLNYLAKSDAMGQDSDAVYGIRPRPAPHEKTQSTNVPLKIREGDTDAAPFIIHTKSAPMNFNELTEEELQLMEASDDEEASLSDSMI